MLMRLTHQILTACVWAAAIGAAGGISAAAGPPPPGAAVDGTCVGVHDGDTITVEFTFRANVRLDECWAPELNEPGGKQSRDALRAVALGKPVRVFVPAPNVFRTIGDFTSLGRIVAEAWVLGSQESLSEMQVRNKHATRTKLARYSSQRRSSIKSPFSRTER